MTRSDWIIAALGAVAGGLTFFLFVRWLPEATFPGVSPFVGDDSWWLP